MFDTLFDAPLWIFVICLIGAIVTWLAADQFRDQLVADSHRLVREVALRYLQIMIGIFTLLLVGMVWSVGRFTTRSIQGLAETPEPTATETPTPTVTLDPFFNPPTITPLPTEPAPLPTVTLPNLPPDPSLSNVRTATVVGTNGVGVNLRDEPGLGGVVIAIVPESTTVTLQGEPQNVDGLTWYLVVTPEGREGWATDLYLDLGE
ncbi:MAG: SH3 domain-containing protein [Anaerolineales bacterium]